MHVFHVCMHTSLFCRISRAGNPTPNRYPNSPTTSTMTTTAIASGSSVRSGVARDNTHLKRRMESTTHPYLRVHSRGGILAATHTFLHPPPSPYPPPRPLVFVSERHTAQRETDKVRPLLARKVSCTPARRGVAQHTRELEERCCV